MTFSNSETLPDQMIHWLIEKTATKSIDNEHNCQLQASSCFFTVINDHYFGWLVEISAEFPWSFTDLNPQKNVLIICICGVCRKQLLVVQKRHFQDSILRNTMDKWQFCCFKLTDLLKNKPFLYVNTYTNILLMLPWLFSILEPNKLKCKTICLNLRLLSECLQYGDWTTFSFSGKPRARRRS